MLVDNLKSVPSFGPPRDFREAFFVRLPDERNMPVDYDEAIGMLSVFKDVLAESILTFSSRRRIPLDERMVPLTQDELSLLERFSFRRKKLLFKGDWLTLPRPGPGFDEWLSVYDGGDDNYHHWRVWEMGPEIEEGIVSPVLICTQTSNKFNDGTQKGLVESDFGEDINVGLVSYREFFLALRRNLYRGITGLPDDAVTDIYHTG